MRRVVLLLTLMAVSILVASGVAVAIINGQPDRNAHPYVGALVTDFDGVNLPLCSGTLISPRVFLTAGHCTDFIRDERPPTFVSFDPTFDQSSELIPGTPYTHPRFCIGCAPGLPGFDRFDVGVVVLDRPVTTAKGFGELPERRLVDTLEKGQLLTVVGYGAQDFEVGGGPQQPVYLDVRHRATVKLIDIENGLGEMFIKTREASAGRGGEGTCFGDSGGPYFLPDQRTVVAVTSFGTNFVCAGVGYAQRVDLPRVLSWVRSFL